MAQYLFRRVDSLAALFLTCVCVRTLVERFSMGEGFRRFKSQILLNGWIKCALCALAAAAASVGGVMLGFKLSEATLGWYWYLAIGVGAAALGFGAVYLFSLHGDVRIAKRLDGDMALGERVQTMVEYRDEQGGMIELQREDAEARLSALSGNESKYLFSGLLGFIIAAVLSVALLVTALLIPGPGREGPGGSGGDEPTFEMNDWQRAALEELIKTVRESAMEETPRTKTVAQLQALLDALDASVTESVMKERVKGAVAAIDSYVDAANSFDEIKDGLGKKGSDEMKAIYAALGTLTVTQTRESFDPFKALFLGEGAGDKMAACAADLKSALEGLDVSDEDGILLGLLAFANALDSASQLSSGQITALDSAVDGAVSAIAPVKERQKNNYQMGEHAVKRLMQIFGLTAADVGRVESGEHGDYDDEDKDNGLNSGGIGTGELVFADDGMVLDITTGEFVKYSEILTEYVKRFNEKRQDGLLDELLEEYGDDYFALLYGSGASQN